MDGSDDEPLPGAAPAPRRRTYAHFGTAHNGAEPGSRKGTGGISLRQREAQRNL